MKRLSLHGLVCLVTLGSGPWLWANAYLSDDMLALMASVETMDVSPSPQAPAPSFPLTNIRLFPGHVLQDNWRWELYGGVVEQHSHDETVFFANYALENDLTEDVALAAVFSLYAVDQVSLGAHDSVGVGFNLRLRDYFERGDGWQRFNEAYMGVSRFNRRTPDLGTHFNFTWGFGTGLKWQSPKGGHAFVVALRYQHFSNNNKDGPDKNPGIDAFGGYFGFEVPF